MEGYIKGALLGQGTFGKVHQYTSKEVRMLTASLVMPHSQSAAACAWLG